MATAWLHDIEAREQLQLGQHARRQWRPWQRVQLRQPASYGGGTGGNGGRHPAASVGGPAPQGGGGDT